MQLGLSSAAAPDLPLADLLEGCRRRGLAALELVLGHGHGVGGGAGEPPAEAVLDAARRAEIRIAALAVPADRIPSEEDLRLAVGLDVPLVLPARGRSMERVAELAGRLADHGGRTLLLHSTDPDAAWALRGLVEALPPGAAALAWEVDPAVDDPAGVPALLGAAGPALGYVRLHGGGPEAAQQTGLGVGSLMGRLALSRYAGPLVLTPGNARYHYAWRAWLGRAGGWGCGSKQSDPSLVTLARAAGGTTKEIR